MGVTSSLLSIQAAMDTMHFSEKAGGPGDTAVVHDVAFDPRSPLQRGTTVPAGCVPSLVSIGNYQYSLTFVGFPELPDLLHGHRLR